MSHSEPPLASDAESWVANPPAGHLHLDGHAEPRWAGRVLVAEDQYVIALDLSEALERSGVKVLGPVATLDAAMRLLHRHDDVAGAILDVTLQGTAVYPLAETLRRRGVPFVFSTGYPRDGIAPAFRDAVFCEKPTPAAKVVQALQGEIARLLPGEGPRCDAAPTQARPHGLVASDRRIGAAAGTGSHPASEKVAGSGES